MSFLTEAQDDLGALLNGTILLVRRGLPAAIGSMLLLGLVGVGLPFAGLLAGNAWFVFAVILGPFFGGTLLYAGPLAAFAIALDRRPPLVETLGLALRRLPALAVISVPGAVMGTGLFAVGLLAVSFAGAPPDRSPALVANLLLALFGIMMTVTVLRMWARYFLFPAAVAVAEGNGVRPAYARSQLLAKKRMLVFSVAATLPFFFVVAAMPDPTSQSAAHQVLDPRGVALLRVVVGAVALFASLLACAALSIAAYGLASGRLDGGGAESHDSDPRS